MSNETEFAPYQSDVIEDFRIMFEYPLSAHDIGWYANVLVEMMVSLWLISWLMDILFWKFWEKYQKMSILTRRNIITYFHEIAVTSVLLVWMLYLVDSLLFRPDYNKSNITQLLFIGMILIVLYIFELIYRLEMRWQLILHHLVTITLLILSVTKFEHDSYIDENGVPVLKVYNIKGAVMMALTALTEQPIFIGLLLYRLGYRYPKLFYVSTFQNAICKLVLHSGMVVMYFKDKVYEDPFWKWFMFLCVTVVLLPVQLYACYIQFLIGRRIEAKEKEMKKKEMENERKKSKRLSVKSQEMNEIKSKSSKSSSKSNSSPETKKHTKNSSKQTRSKTSGGRSSTKSKRTSSRKVTNNKDLTKKDSKRKSNDDIIVDMSMDEENENIIRDIRDTIDDYIGAVDEERMYESEEEDDVITKLFSNSNQTLNTIPRTTSFLKRGKSELNFPQK